MRIAHTVFEALYRAPVNRLECQVFCLLLRRSWGFSKKTVAISTEAIAVELERSQRNVQLALKSLVDYNMVFMTEAATKYKPGVYGPNKMFSQWTFPSDRPKDSPRDQYDRAIGSAERSIRSRGVQDLIARRVDFDRAAEKIEGENPDEQGVFGTTNTCSKKLSKETLKEIPPTPKGVGEAAGGDGDCLGTDELVDPQEAARANEPGSVDPTKLASLLTRFQVDHLKSLCLQDLQGVEPVLVPRARAKLETYLNTLPPAGWQESPQRWAAYLRHWVQAGVKEVQEKRRDLMKMNDEYRKKHGVKFPADMAIQIAARLCGEMLAEKGVA